MGAAARRFRTTRRKLHSRGAGRRFTRLEADGQHIKLAAWVVGVTRQDLEILLAVLKANGAVRTKLGPWVKVQDAFPPVGTAPIGFRPTIRIAVWLTRQLGGVDPNAHPVIVADFIQHTADLHVVEPFGECKSVADPHETDESDDDDDSRDVNIGHRAEERIKQQSRECVICHGQIVKTDNTCEWP